MSRLVDFSQLVEWVRQEEKRRDESRVYDENEISYYLFDPPEDDVVLFDQSALEQLLLMEVYHDQTD